MERNHPVQKRIILQPIPRALLYRHERPSTSRAQQLAAPHPLYEYIPLPSDCAFNLQQEINQQRQAEQQNQLNRQQRQPLLQQHVGQNQQSNSPRVVPNNCLETYRIQAGLPNPMRYNPLPQYPPGQGLPLQQQRQPQPQPQPQPMSQEQDSISRQIQQLLNEGDEDFIRNRQQQAPRVRQVIENGQVIRYVYPEEPLTLNVWTQTQPEQIPTPPPPAPQPVVQPPQPQLDVDVEALLAKINKLENTITLQDEFICILQEPPFGMTSAPQASSSPNSTKAEVKKGVPNRDIEAVAEAEGEDRDEGEDRAEGEDGVEAEVEAVAEDGSEAEAMALPINDVDELPTLPMNSFSSELGLSDLENDDDFEINLSRPESRASDNLVMNSNTLMVSIGPNNTLIPASTYKALSWQSHSIVTRQLLNIVFGRQTLATSSITGRTHNRNKPKARLDEKSIYDIIYCITRKFKIESKVVRATIRVKCAEEDSMVRFPQKNTHPKPDSSKSILKEQNRMISNDPNNTDTD